MNSIHENFIGVYENAFNAQFCDSLIKHFNNMESVGFAENRMQSEGTIKNKKDDVAVFVHDSSAISFKGSTNLVNAFNSIFWDKYREYVSNFSIINDSGAHNNYSFKIQKTEVGGGYHVWHYESDNRASCNRLLTWILYLNNVEEGGETEFLYYPKRIKPKTGTLLIWPAAFTHTHRGNPPISNSKYVVTGWIEF